MQYLTGRKNNKQNICLDIGLMGTPSNYSINSEFLEISTTNTLDQGCNARKVISEVYTSFAL